MDDDTFEVTVSRQDRYRFRVDFGDGSGAVLQMDEPSPLGAGAGPNAARVLAAAIGNCLSASLLFCLDKAKVEVSDLRTTVTGSVVRNEEGRYRLGPLEARVEPVLETDAPARIERCLEIFEDFCTVTASVRAGVDVQVDVEATAPTDGELVEAGA